MILFYARIVRKHAERGNVLPRVWVFIGGYVAAWTAFSAVATVGQILLQRAAGIGLGAAGLWQLLASGGVHG